MTTAAIHPFAARLREAGLSMLRRGPLRELQVNVGRLCNQACHHCHVDAGPKRTEIMNYDTAERVVDWGRGAEIKHADITGGAPELNPNFRWMVDRFLEMGAKVTARCNLTVLFEPGQEDLAEWYAERDVRLVASLPCYTRANVDAQRGDGVFDKSIAALQQLNTLGYGSDPVRVLDLVYNPGGPFLPGNQAQLEIDYRKHLGEEFGIRFSGLLALANLPINRFRHALARDGKLDDYRQLLADSFNPDTVEGLMCRQLVSVDWRGYVYDCDFNQMLDLPLAGQSLQKLWEIDPGDLDSLPVATGEHCYGCTAGSGSSCGGALV